MKLKITAKELREMGYPQSPVIPVAMEIMQTHYKYHTTEEATTILKNVLADPSSFLDDEILYKIAERLTERKTVSDPEISLNNSGIPFNTFGSEHIEPSAMQQMYIAAKLPVSRAGALMPDAHHGYGLPIGGVLATENAIIPYGVGVDIGCRMCLSIFDLHPSELKAKESFFVKELDDATLFGSGAQFKTASNHEVMENPLFTEIPLLRSLHGKAWKQLGSSGSGNHFAEFGIVTISEEDEILKTKPGQYIGLLTHSGSRALGALIAGHFTKLAKQKRRLPKDASNLAWLDLNEEEGMEYWLSMNLAGDYASACHHIIHDKIAKRLHTKPIRRVENHHNFAWKEMHEGRELIVHRKGATPAGKNVLGIIPGSMTATGYIVKGKGETASVNSASHGAGRILSRTAAMNIITPKAMRDILEEYDVILMGGGLDESPFVYKDIDMVMKAQQNLVDVVGSFKPKIVKMAGNEGRPYKKKGHESVE